MFADRGMYRAALVAPWLPIPLAGVETVFAGCKMCVGTTMAGPIEHIQTGK